MPTLAVKGFTILGDDRSDLYGFVENRVLFPPVDSIAEFRVDDVIAFYSADWGNRFRYYDADIRFPLKQIQQEIRDEICHVVDS